MLTLNVGVSRMPSAEEFRSNALCGAADSLGKMKTTLDAGETESLVQDNRQISSVIAACQLLTAIQGGHITHYPSSL